MDKVENRASLADCLMLGPDGAVYALRTGTRQEPSDDLGGAVSPRLPQHSRDGGVGGGCFAYSAEAPRRGGGNGTICFKYSAEAPSRGGGSGTICFKYSAEAPSRDGGVVHPCFAY
jgi:hypothetical protein